MAEIRANDKLILEEIRAVRAEATDFRNYIMPKLEMITTHDEKIKNIESFIAGHNDSDKAKKSRFATWAGILISGAIGIIALFFKKGV